MQHALWFQIPRSIRYVFMKYLFGISKDYRKTGRVVLHNRLLLAARYIEGDGIEIGGLNRPLKVGRNARVKYVDRFSGEELKKNYFGTRVRIRILRPDIVANGETLDPIADGSQSFVIANHVVEHFENPILFFKNAFRVLKDGGILFLAVPDKEKTFDHRRPVTPYDHIKRDFLDGPEASKAAHFLEYAALTGEEVLEGAAAVAKADELLREDQTIHYHVWDIEAMVEMITKIRDDFGLAFRIRCMLSTGNECIFILEKQA